jgi:hypothetical protein
MLVPLSKAVLPGRAAFTNEQTASDNAPVTSCSSLRGALINEIGLRLEPRRASIENFTVEGVARWRESLY